MHIRFCKLPPKDCHAFDDLRLLIKRKNRVNKDGAFVASHNYDNTEMYRVSND